MVNLRRLEKTLDVDLPETACVTLGGVVHEALQKLAEPGDQCRWGRLMIEVLETEGRANMLVEVSVGDAQEASQ
jgi:CBS domain containing-hemolysin-like protein